MDLVANTGKPLFCDTFNGWTRLWLTEAPGYTDVPSNWWPLYYEYRSILQQIVSITGELRDLCAGEGGLISDETVISILIFLQFSYPRSEQMVIEAAQIP
jgi:hypothetical protein